MVWLAVCSVPKQGVSALHVDKLKWNVVILLLKQTHDFLEVIDFLTGNPDLVVLNSWLDLELKALDEFDDFLAGLFGDTLPDKDICLCRAMGGGFDLLAVQTFGIHLKPSALTNKHL